MLLITSFWEDFRKFITSDDFPGFLLAIFIIYIFFKITGKDFHSHWNTLIDDFNYSSKDFYADVKKELLSQGIQGISTSFVHLKQGGISSARRLYLRVEWKDYYYDICAAPFGKGFFVSWWCFYKITLAQILINKIPKIGPWIVRILYPKTYYKIDTASMFMTYCHQSVQNVIDNICKANGIPGLLDHERKPILKDIFSR